MNLRSCSRGGDAYLMVTRLVADPQELLRTVIDWGFVGHANSPLYLPPPSFAKAATKTPDDVTNT
jgi:hypothetical protein